MKRNLAGTVYIRNFIFGVEDSLVSTVGLLSGVASANIPKDIIFVTGIVLIFVEAISMAAGSFLSESSAEEFVAQKEVSETKPFWGSIVMFFSYFLAGFIPLAPYGIFEISSAFWFSIIFSVIALLILGYLSAKISNVKIITHSLRMALIGGIAIAVGVGVGKLLSGFSF